MDTRISEFSPIKIARYVSELDLLSNPVLNTQEKEFLADLYDFMEKILDPELKKLEELNYLEEEPIQVKKRAIVIDIMKKLDKVLGVMSFEEDKIDEDIQSLIDLRTEARKRKDWAEADRIRNALEARGIILLDKPEGTIWRKEKLQKS